MSHRIALALACLATLMISAPLQAATVNLSPTADVRILSIYPDSNEGNGAFLSVYTEPGNVQRSLLQFDIASIPAGGQIDSAILTIFIDLAYANNNASNRNMDVHAVTTPWLESQATWNSATTGNPWGTAGGDFDPTVYATSNVNGPAFTPITWDVTDLVREWYNGSLDNNGLLIKSFTGNGLHFSSFEVTTESLRPFLVVNYTAVPEPGSIVLMSVGLIAFAGIARRKGRVSPAVPPTC